MSEKGLEEKGEKKYLISISDWIIFLGDKSSTNVNLLVFTGYISVIALITLLEYSTSLNLHPILIIILVTSGYLIFFGVITYMGNKTKPYQDLLEEIIRGEITNSEKILEKYKTIWER